LEKEVLTRRSAEQELLRLNAELQDSVHRDALTGLSSRSAFQEALATHWESHGRSGRPLSLLMVDVDHFKSFNDRYGHLRGDEALRVVARCLRAGLGRQGDLAARYGGEEFALILPNTSTEGAIRVAQRIRRLMAEAAVPHLDSSVGQRLTVSIGVATAFPDPYGDPAQLVAAADLALYDVKNSGRDGVSTASSPVRGVGDIPPRTEIASEQRLGPAVPAPRLWI
jgi:diguanylate cyclase (GGDEF)-like protein